MRFPAVAVLALCFAVSAQAQRAVILEVDGDANGRLRQQIETAIRRNGSVELLPIERFKEVAARKKLKGGAAMTAVGVSRVAKSVDLDVAVGGELSASSVRVFILDRTGNELWTKELQVRKGLLSDDFAGKLARAVAAAAEQAAQTRGPVATGEPDEGGEEASEPAPEPRPRTSRPQRGGGDEATESDPDGDLEQEGEAKNVDVKVPIIRFGASFASVWRSQCMLPGLESCAGLESLRSSNSIPPGRQIIFSGGAPALGVDLTVEAFPMARFSNRVARGFGVVGHFQYSSGSLTVRNESVQGAGAENRYTYSDLNWSAQLTWRFFFGTGFGSGEKSLSYVGLRGGLGGRLWALAADPTNELPSAVRPVYPQFALDAAFAFVKYLRASLSAGLLISPRTSEEQIVSFGNLSDPTGGVTSFGWFVEAGLGGELYGPLGWNVRFNYTGFRDRYVGIGTVWSQPNLPLGGGIAEESFLTLLLGLTVQF